MDLMIANNPPRTAASTFLLNTGSGISANALPFDNSMNLFSDRDVADVRTLFFLAPDEPWASGVDITVVGRGLSPLVFPWRCRRWWLLAFPNTGSDLCHEMKGRAIYECPVSRRHSLWLRYIDRLERRFAESAHSSRAAGSPLFEPPKFDLEPTELGEVCVARPIFEKLGRRIEERRFPPKLGCRGGRTLTTIPKVSCLPQLFAIIAPIPLLPQHSTASSL